MDKYTLEVSREELILISRSLRQMKGNIYEHARELQDMGVSYEGVSLSNTLHSIDKLESNIVEVLRMEDMIKSHRRV